MRFGNYTATVTAADMGWGKKAPRAEFKPGYLAYFEIKEADKKAHRLKVELTQIPGVQGAMVSSDPERFFVPPYVGGRGWLGVYLDVPVDWDEIAEIVEDAYRTVAPKRLIDQLEEA